MMAAARLKQLERLADLRVTASEKRVAEAARAEVRAKEAQAHAEQALEGYHTRLPSLRQQTYREYASENLNRGGLDILHAALAELDRTVDLHVADVDAAKQQVADACEKRAACAESHRRLIAAQRRRAKLGEKLAEAAARKADRREEMELDEWRRAIPA